MTSVKRLFAKRVVWNGLALTCACSILVACARAQVRGERAAAPVTQSLASPASDTPDHPRWSYVLDPGDHATSVLITGSFLVVQTRDGVLVLDAHTGQRRWYLRDVAEPSVEGTSVLLPAVAFRIESARRGLVARTSRRSSAET